MEFQDSLEQFALDGDDATRETGTDSGGSPSGGATVPNATGTTTAAFVGDDCRWQHQDDALSAVDGCQAHDGTPWQCPDGTCVAAMGECVLRAWEAPGGEGHTTGQAWSLGDAVAANQHGLVAESYTQSPLASTHASSGGLSAYKATDGNRDTSFWQSTRCYPAYVPVPVCVPRAAGAAEALLLVTRVQVLRASGRQRATRSMRRGEVHVGLR